MKNIVNKLKKSDFADKITLILAMLLLLVLFGSLNRNYVTFANIINILIACSLTGFVAIGETNLIIAGQNEAPWPPAPGCWPPSCPGRVCPCPWLCWPPWPPDAWWGRSTPLWSRS